MTKNSRHGSGSRNLSVPIFKMKQQRKEMGRSVRLYNLEALPPSYVLPPVQAAPPKPPYTAPPTGNHMLTYLSPWRTVLIQTTMVCSF